MPRIFKFSKFALKLFVPHASKLTDMKIYIYTDNFDIAYVVTSGFKINVNEVGIVIPQNAVNNMSDGIINYRIEGYLNGEFYMEQRQSNYFLKTPSFEIEDTNIIAISTEFVDEGNYKMIIKASEYNVDGLSQVEIDATTFAEEKYEEGNVAGIEIGKEVQKAKLTGITITENGVFTSEDGYNEITVAVPDLNGDYQTGYDAGKVDGYNRGYDEGETDQKDKLESISITENGTYSREDGYNEIHVEVPDLNGDYQTGYDAGYVDGEYRGFNNGYTAGETDQKDKLESISITENGTYTREDGYNEVIVNVEQEGGGLNPDTLREITITKNGTYTSKYSELIKTGEFEDETLFYGFGRIDGAVYDTQINLNEVGTLESLEFWHKGDGADESGMYYEREILSSNSEVMPNEGSIEFRYEFDMLVVQIGHAQEYLQLEEGVWHHFKLSKTGDDTCTLFVDDEEKYSFPLPTATSTNFYINGVAYDEGLTRNANGYFGLININGHIIIPTENGFMNYNTQTILPTLKEGSYTYGNYVDEGEPYKTINVDIPLQAKYEWYGDTAEDFTILPDEGYGGMSKVDVNISSALSTKYDEGFEQGKNGIINSLQTLNVTSNGTYTPPITPFLRLDSDDKYEMFFPSENNAFEIKFRNSAGEFFTQKSNNPNFITLRADTSISVLIIKWFNKEIKISDVDFSKWHTLVVKMGDENARVIFDGQVYNDYTQYSSNKNNGNAVNIYRKIDLVHFAFWNTWEDYNNGVTPHFDFKASPEGLMKNQQGGEYSVVDNIGGGSAQYIEEKETEGWNEVVVDVAGGTTGSLALVDGTKFQNSTFTEIPDYYDFSNITDMSNIFKNCYDLQTISELNTSNATNMRSMFNYCSKLQTIPQIDTSNVTDMYEMFNNCIKLQTIPQIDTRNVTDMSFMFYGCRSLQTIPQIDTSNVTAMNRMFDGCDLSSIPSFDCSSLSEINMIFGNQNRGTTDVGGWIGLKTSWTNGLDKLPNLNYQSCINILNGLADVSEKGGRTLNVHQNFLGLVGDEVSIGTDKGWIISA